ncbi:phage neck terminator protein [Actinobacillus seminis]|uniref:phage neck terminator protein n=1 Tax=Actinobacillus seminis TaxID=722 RepID=UPI003B92F832
METNITLKTTHDDIYREVRAYLLGLFHLEGEKVIRGYSNNVPLPQQSFILMNIIYERALTTNVHFYDVNSGITEVLQSVEIQMQIDFYGENSGEMARTFCTLWRDVYACEHFSYCQPLYCDEPRYLPFTNEASEYEQRYLVTINLAYNPVIVHPQDFITNPSITLEKL